MKVLSYNIHKGRAFFSRKRSWHVLEELLFHTQPDLVFLQEFFREPETEQMLENLADHLWPHHSYGQNAVSGDYHYGNAILSRYPILKSKNHNISTSTYEKRGVLYAQVEIREKPVHLYCTHLDLTESGRLVQVRKIKKFISTLSNPTEPLILAGDFNDWNNRLHSLFVKSMDLRDSLSLFQGALVPTFPSVLPLFPLDKIYFRHFDVLKADRIINKVLRYQSDHLPIFTEFSIKKTSVSS